jgi:hypothetical protein
MIIFFPAYCFRSSDHFRLLQSCAHSLTISKIMVTFCATEQKVLSPLIRKTGSKKFSRIIPLLRLPPRNKSKKTQTAESRSGPVSCGSRLWKCGSHRRHRQIYSHALSTLIGNHQCMQFESSGLSLEKEN